MGLISKTNASSKAIFEHLCDQMNKLNAKVITVDEAKEQSNLSKQANNILRYELDRAIATAKFGDKLKINEIERGVK
jgi:signal transduction histidine kinase